MKVRHVCLWPVGMFSWRCYEQDTQHAARPEALVDIYAPTGCREKKETSAQSRLCQVFLFGARTPIFQACVGCASCQRPPEELLFLNLFILFRVCLIFVFIFYVVGCFISYLIPTNNEDERMT